MNIIEKDILTVERGIICQQVNCQIVMGSGLAMAIRDKWPIVYEDYINDCLKYKNDFERLGLTEYVKVGDKLFICNIFGQLYYGYDRKKRYTDYSALNTAFRDIAQEKDQLGKLDIYFPFNFGCDRGGADWNIVSKMIEFYFPDAIICKLPSKVLTRE
jgi:O-acetyl-ADP-ribose deacetylase (regulator of RNase III)